MGTELVIVTVSFIFSRHLLKLLMNGIKMFMSTRSNIGLGVWLPHMNLFRLPHRLDISEQSEERKADGPLQILFFEISVLFCLILQE